MKYKVSYIGNYYKVAEMILFNEDIELTSIICEKEKLNEDLITFSLVRNIRLITVNTKVDLVSSLQKTKREINFFIMCSFGKRIPMESLNDVKIFNIHYSSLPYFKGRHPTYWATVCGEKEIGISIHTVTENIDEGEIVAQEKTPYYLWMNEDDLFCTLTEKIPLLLNSCIEYVKGRKTSIANKKGYYYSIVSEENITIDLTKDDYGMIYNKVRAQAKYKGAKISLDDNIYCLKKVKFIYKEMEEMFKIAEDDILYIRYNDCICLKSEDYCIEKEVMK